MTTVPILPSVLGLPDEDGWQAFLKGHRRRVRKLLRVAVRLYGSFPWADFDDLEQEVYCRLLAVHSPAASASGSSAYLRRVVDSVVLDHRRACLAEKRKPEWASPRHCQDDEISGEMVYRSWATTPEQDLRRREGWRQICRHGQRVCRSGRRGRLELSALRLVLTQGCSSPEASARLEGKIQPHEVDRLIGRLRRSLLHDGIRLPRRRASARRSVGLNQRSRRSR